MSNRSRAATVLGAACALALLLTPAALPAQGADVVVPSVLPLGFFGAGAVAQVLRPGHPVGIRLLAVGVLHLAALVGAVVGAVDPGSVLAGVLAWLSAALYTLGFVALLDLLALFPTGRYAWAPVGSAVRGAAVVAVLVATVAWLGSPGLPSVLGLDAGANPLHVPALAGGAGAVAAVILLPVVGFCLLVARYPRASAADRIQMRWPIATAAAVAVGLVTTGLAEDVLGSDTQTALFVAAGVALPLSFLVGLLRHTEEADRLAAAEASRARLVRVADEQRRRIERDLHDGAQQQILALLARVELARAEHSGHDDVAAELRDIAEELRSVHRDLRELARGVHPAVLTDHGLAEAVRSALARFPAAAELAVSPEVEGRRYPSTVEGAAYFLVLEGLSNAMKHAAGSRARVTLAQCGSMLEVTVSDDGPGFADDGEAGTGLVGLRDRLVAVGGTLDVDSRPGTGTTLRGRLPALHHAD